MASRPYAIRVWRTVSTDETPKPDEYTSEVLRPRYEKYWSAYAELRRQVLEYFLQQDAELHTFERIDVVKICKRPECLASDELRHVDVSWKSARWYRSWPARRADGKKSRRKGKARFEQGLELPPCQAEAPYE